MIKKKTISLKESMIVKDESDSENEKVKPKKAQKIIKNFLRVRPFEGVNKLFTKSLDQKNERPHKVSINKSLFSQEQIKESGSEFLYDAIFDENTPQFDVFQETCLPLIEDLVENRNSSILLVEGLNDSGKTFTVVGDNENPGILPLTLRLIYDKLKDKPKDEVKILCNYLEIYGKDYVDLLSDEKTEPIKIIKDIYYFKNATFYPLEKIQDFSNALNLGNKKKKMKMKNSLSNTIFKIMVRFINKQGNFYEQQSLTIIDTAHPIDRDFPNVQTCGEMELDFMEPNLYHLQLSLCRMVNRGLYYPIKSRTKTTPTNYTLLSSLFKIYIYHRYNIVLLSNIKPKLDLNEENLKLFNFSQKFILFVQKVDASSNINKNILEKFNKLKILPENLSPVLYESSNPNSKEKSTKDFLANRKEKNNDSKIDDTSPKRIDDSPIKESLQKKIDESEKKEMPRKYLTNFLTAREKESIITPQVTTRITAYESRAENNLKLETIEKEFKELEKKCKEQEETIKMLEKKEKSEGAVNLIQNNNQLGPKECSIAEKNLEVERFIKNISLPNFDLDKIPSGVRLFNVIITNPTIQNLTISSKCEEIQEGTFKNIIPERNNEVNESEMKKVIEKCEEEVTYEKKERRGRPPKINRSDQVCFHKEDKKAPFSESNYSLKMKNIKLGTKSDDDDYLHRDDKKKPLIPSDHCLKRKHELFVQKIKQKSNKAKK